MKEFVDYEAEHFINSRDFCIRSINSKLFGNYKDTIITNLLISDIEKLYPDAKIDSSINYLSCVDGESDIKIENFGNLLEEIP